MSGGASRDETPPEGVGRWLDVQRLGRRPYDEVHALQLDLLRRRIEGRARDTLVLVEHDPVITVGRGADGETGRAELGELTLPVVEVERGGEATYHGPGQVVAYPILELPEGRRDLHRYLRDLEEVVLRVLSEFGVEGSRRAGATGVWVGDGKIASIGVAVRRWVTWHGLALNVHTRLSDFAGFRPCGFDPGVMIRLADLVDLPPGNILCEVLVVKHVLEVFGLELPPPPPRPESPFPELPILE